MCLRNLSSFATVENLHSCLFSLAFVDLWNDLYTAVSILIHSCSLSTLVGMFSSEVSLLADSLIGPILCSVQLNIWDAGRKSPHCGPGSG